MKIARRLQRSLVAASIALFGAVACEEAPSTMAVHAVDNPWNFAWSVLRSGPMLVEIRGDPFGVDPERFRNVTLAAMNGSIQRNASWAVTTDPESAGSQEIRIVVTFNGSSNVNGIDQCLGRSRGGGPIHRGFIWVVATLCDGRSVLANVTGEIAKTSGIDDPNFDALVSQVMLDMFEVESHP